MGLLTDRINSKLEKSNLINEHALNRQPVPLIEDLRYVETYTWMCPYRPFWQFKFALPRAARIS